MSGAGTRPRSRAALLTGVVLLIPRIVVAWLVLDRTLVPVLATVAFVVGLLLLGRLLHPRLLGAVRSRWWEALVGLAAALAGALGTSGVAALAADVAVPGYRGVLAPPPVALTNWAFLAMLALWLLGLVLLAAAVLGGLVALVRRPGR